MLVSRARAVLAGAAGGFYTRIAQPLLAEFHDVPLGGKHGTSAPSA